MAYTGGSMTPNESLLRSMSKSFWTMVVEEVETKEILGIFGVVSQLIFMDNEPHMIGIPWALGSKGMVRDKISTVKLGRIAIAKMFETYPVLTNYVHDKNKLSIKWLKWSGFEFDRGESIDLNGEVFLHFTQTNRRKEN